MPRITSLVLSRWTCTVLAVLAGLVAVPRRAAAQCVQTAGPDCDVYNQDCWTCNESPIIDGEAGDSLGQPVVERASNMSV